MKTLANSYNNELDYFNFENLLRKLIFVEGSSNDWREFVTIIDSALAFQNGEFRPNSYLNPSEAYSVLLSVLKSKSSELSLNDLKKNSVEKNEEAIEIVKLLLQSVNEKENIDKISEFQNKLIFSV